MLYVGDPRFQRNYFRCPRSTSPIHASMTGNAAFNSVMSVFRITPTENCFSAFSRSRPPHPLFPRGIPWYYVRVRNGEIITPISKAWREFSGWATNSESVTPQVGCRQASLPIRGCSRPTRALFE